MVSKVVTPLVPTRMRKNRLGIVLTVLSVKGCLCSPLERYYNFSRLSNLSELTKHSVAGVAANPASDELGRSGMRRAAVSVRWMATVLSGNRRNDRRTFGMTMTSRCTLTRLT